MFSICIYKTYVYAKLKLNWDTYRNIPTISKTENVYCI